VSELRVWNAAVLPSLAHAQCSSSYVAETSGETNTAGNKHHASCRWHVGQGPEDYECDAHERQWEGDA
jgi:hypothetical protein